MGWGLRIFALVSGIIALGIGAWPVSLLAAVYLFFSFRKPKGLRASGLRPKVLRRPRRSWGRYSLGSALLLLSAVALGAGGTYSPFVFFVGGLAVLLSPRLRRYGLMSQVVPMNESILLRRRIFPLTWYSLAEVKLEAPDQARGVASMDGRILVFAGKNPNAVRLLGVHAFGHTGAEKKVVKALRQETRMLSQRGAHLLPLDSRDACRRLSLKLERLNVGAYGFEAVSSLPFDIFTLQASGGLVVRHRAFRVEGSEAPASIPMADISLERQPLFAEVVEEITEKHGWPVPDEFSPFLAALDASRTEPFGDRLKIKGEDSGRVAVEAPGGSEVSITRAQLRAIARIYA